MKAIGINPKLVAAVLALSMAATAAMAQGTMKPDTAKSAPPSNAQLQQEISSLREQVRQLQQAQKEAAPAQPQVDKAKAGMAMETPGKAKAKMGMGMMDDMMGMSAKPDAMNAKPSPDPMQKGDPAMPSPMEKDNSMEMPPADSAKPAGMSDM